jgi:hypothetical protein
MSDINKKHQLLLMAFEEGVDNLQRSRRVSRAQIRTMNMVT